MTQQCGPLVAAFRTKYICVYQITNITSRPLNVANIVIWSDIVIFFFGGSISPKVLSRQL
jgi:hypothetical protein